MRNEKVGGWVGGWMDRNKAKALVHTQAYPGKLLKRQPTPRHPHHHLDSYLCPQMAFSLCADLGLLGQIQDKELGVTLSLTTI